MIFIMYSNVRFCVKLSMHHLFTGEAHIQRTMARQDRAPDRVPLKGRFGRDIYHYAGHDIAIQESIDYFGAVMWPGVSNSENTAKTHSNSSSNMSIRGVSVSCRRWLCATSWTTTGSGSTCRERRFWSWEQEQDWCPSWPACWVCSLRFVSGSICASTQTKKSVKFGMCSDPGGMAVFKPLLDFLMVYISLKRTTLHLQHVFLSETNTGFFPLF